MPFMSGIKKNIFLFQSANNTQFAIPNFNNTTNTLIVNGEPGTWQCVATGQQFDYMNGTYTTTGSHFFTGGVTPYASFNCFGRNGLPNLMSIVSAVAPVLHW